MERAPYQLSEFTIATREAQEEIARTLHPSPIPIPLRYNTTFPSPSSSHNILPQSPIPKRQPNNLTTAPLRRR
ncbi:hypothetical protein CC80DRAFT_492907 [Byssothecium circinans]|uniref:Uncharacterized protein n=1 Tax=Byssothecium circinans TaxID=147558 RepID=A0A6A5TSS7_9PLEO|nr:hypothetical protein CC80DRAFT_492907 [Byssothecium circinans]